MVPIAKQAMKRVVLASLMLSSLGATSWAGNSVAPDRGREMADRLKADPGMFCLRLDYVSASAPTTPRHVLSLVSKPLPRPPFDSDMIIDGTQALKIIAHLEGGGFFGRAVEDFTNDPVMPGFVLRVGGAGVDLGERLGESLAAFRCMDALKDILEGEAARGMRQGMESLKDVRDPLEAAERCSDRAGKLAGEPDAFTVWLQCRGGRDDKAFYGLLLSVQPSERYAPVPLQLYALMDREAALKVINRLSDWGVLGSAQAARPAASSYRTTPAGFAIVKFPPRSYAIIVYGRDIAIEQDLGWGDALLERLNGLRAALSGDAAAKMDKLLGAVNRDVAKDREAKERDRQAKEEAAKAAAKMKEDGPRLAAEALAKVRAAATGESFEFRVDYAGDYLSSRYPRTRLTTAPLRPGQAGLYHAIDGKQALRIVGQLEKDGFFTWREKPAASGPAQRYVLTLAAGGVTVREDIGWREPMLQRLESLRALLEGPPAEGMDQILAVVRAEAPGWKPALRYAAPGTQAAAERAKLLRNDLDNFSFILQFRLGEVNPFYRLLLSTKPVSQNPRLPYHLNAVVDRDVAARIIDHLQQSGLLVDPARPSVPRAYPFQRAPWSGSPAPPAVPPPTYKLLLSGGGEATTRDIGWGPTLLARLGGIRALLDGDAAEKMDQLTKAVEAALAEEAEKSRAERVRLGAQRIDRVRTNVKDFTLHMGDAGAGEESARHVTLSMYPFKALGSPQAPWAVLDEKQSLRIIDHLAKEGFFERAEENLRVDSRKPGWVLTVSAGGMAFQEELGWDAPLMKRLKSLLTVLEGDGAEDIGKIIAELGG